MGYISPVEFIPIAEKSNLIIKLSEHLIKIAFKQAYLWSKNEPNFYISVNISVRHFEQNAFVDFLSETLNNYKLSAKNILLEFTESIMLDSTNETINKFAMLKNIGFKIAIDDFGTGYSSLGYIHKMPVDMIKIDRSFINGMIKNKKTQAIVNAICRLSSSLEIKTIAEGIEQTDQAAVLTALNCNYGQGYLYDRPLSIDVFEAKYFPNALVTSKLA
jgi:EAL domain-containing protein (putative c-di-GMP-specific phosphodiesterase class I)